MTPGLVRAATADRFLTVTTGREGLERALPVPSCRQDGRAADIFRENRRFRIAFLEAAVLLAERNIFRLCVIALRDERAAVKGANNLFTRARTWCRKFA